MARAVSGRTYTRKCLVEHARKAGEMTCCLRRQQLLILEGGLEQKGEGHYVYVRPSHSGVLGVSD